MKSTILSVLVIPFLRLANLTLIIFTILILLNPLRNQPLFLQLSFPQQCTLHHVYVPSLSSGCLPLPSHLRSRSLPHITRPPVWRSNPLGFGHSLQDSAPHRAWVPISCTELRQGVHWCLDSDSLYLLPAHVDVCLSPLRPWLPTSGCLT